MGRTGQLRHTLNRLCDLTLPDEILIVDDGGSDGCDQVVPEFSDRLPIRYIFNNNPGQTICSMARNIGIRNTDADIVVTSEPEAMFITDVLAQLLAHHAIEPTKVISAGTVHHAQRSDVRDVASCMTIRGWVAPFTALYVRDWLMEIQGWDESFPSRWGWDDTDLLTRLRVKGHGQVIDLGSEILHQWHGSSAVDQKLNEQHFLAKNLQHDGAHVVANEGVEWGQTRP